MKQLTIVGSGVYAATLCEQLAASSIAGPMQITLAARNRERLGVIGNYCRQRIASRPDWVLHTETNLAAAVSEADDIVLLIRVGGLAARRYDETFPLEFGQVGDEGLGLGGLSNTWRTLPVLESVAETIRQNAPMARVINMLAPLGTTTRLLAETGLNAFGVCELPLTTEESFGGSPQHFDYAGLNHLGWFRPNCDAGEEVLRQAMDQNHVDRLVTSHFGAATLFYYYRVFAPAAARRMGCAFQSGRAAQLQDLTDDVLTEFRAAPEQLSATLQRRSTPWFDRGLVPIMSALLDETDQCAFDGFVNTTNDGLVPGLPGHSVVEVRAKWHRGRFTPKPCSKLTAAASGFLRRVAQADDFAYRAARERCPDLLRKAIAALPLEITQKQQHEIVDAITRTSRSASKAA